VICIDNGSTPPLDQDWVESFGPEFRLLRPSVRSSSPCAAINEAARQAKGRYLAIMIDGAHVLTPGVFREVWDAVDDTPDAIVGLRQWFVGGDQRWLSISGHTREKEDILFEKIFWPQDGYRLFKIGTPIWESPNHWLDGMIESNCLFVPRTIYERIGGMDEAFDEPGGGYANLDLFKRAVAASPEPFNALLGEASFHQFHDGTTTNVADTEKDVRVRGYENTYMLLRGEHYAGIRPVDIRQRGQLRAQSAVVGRQRPLSPARLGVTDKVRQGSLPIHFDAMSAANLQSVYVECGLHRLTKWCGHEVGLAPADIVEIQDIVGGVRPSRIIAVNAGFGVVNMLDSFLRMAGRDDGRVLWVGAKDEAGKVLPASVEVIAGDPYASETLAAVERALDLEEDILVLFAPRQDDYTPIGPLRDYARFVSCRSYLVFLGTVFGQPWLGYSKYWFQSAVKTIVREMPFVIDHSRNQQLVTVCPNGYLQRILTSPATSMDDLVEFDDL
jgi:cephalosporin hydroxylase